MKLIFIRHGATKGNSEHRYIGTTDEPLSEKGIEALENMYYPECDIVLTSPMKRCIQTAEIIYPNNEMVIVNDFRECDFGIFEGKNYKELSGDTDYQRWIDSNGTEAFPDGEHPSGFRKRCAYAFIDNLPSCESAAYVVHGGTIMSVLSEFAGGDYYDYQIGNGMGYITEWTDGKLEITGKIQQQGG